MSRWFAPFLLALIAAPLLVLGCGRLATAPNTPAPAQVNAARPTSAPPTSPRPTPAPQVPKAVEAAAPSAPAVADTQAPGSLLSLSDAELEARLLSDPASIGSLSVGAPNAGRLFNGQQLAQDRFFKPVDAAHAWGTAETLAYLRSAAEKVHAQFPGSPQLYVGHLSAERGGRLSPHKSHQTGRDVDISYFYTDDGRWYQRATPTNLDLARTWAFVRALITETDVEMILIDSRLSHALRSYAVRQGEDAAWLATIFEHSRASRALVRHAPGHATHMHIRFYNPLAQALARRLYPTLVEHELIDKVQIYRYHRVRKGETLGKLAKRYGTTVRAIKQANGLRSSVIQAKKTYKIPTGAKSWPVEAPFQLPERRLPPTPSPDRAVGGSPAGVARPAAG